MGEKMTRQQAKRWVQEYWQATIRSSEIPDLPDQFYGAIAEVFEEESQRIANRIGPTHRKIVRQALTKEAQS